MSVELKRIAIFIPSLGGGGAEKNIVTLANGFRNAGIRVELILADRTGPNLERLNADIRIIDLKTRKVSRSVFKLANYLRDSKPDVLLSTLSHANIAALFAAKLSNTDTRLVIREATTVLPRTHRSFSYLVILSLMKLLYPKADRVVAISQGVAKSLLENTHISPERISVVYNPSIEEGFQKRLEQTCVHEWFVADQVPVIIGVGRLTSQKNFPLLIESYIRIRKRRYVRLAILGCGEEEVSLKKLAAESEYAKDIWLPGFIANPLPYVSRSKVFVLSSTFEGAPSALIEAMACGVNIVSTDSPSGPAEILEFGRWGRLVPVGDVDSMATAIEEQLDSPPLIGIQQNALERFSVERATQEYLNVLLEAR